MTFVPAHIDETKSDVLITPIIKTLRFSPYAPKTSKWCEFNEPGTFTEVDGATLKRLRDEQPLSACYPWINEKQSIGPAVIYGDGTGQGIGVYYPPDFNARAVRITRPKPEELLR
jgi:hypothetical protein